MAYVFNTYRDKGGIGHQEICESKEKALEKAWNEWYRLCEKDQKTYKEDPVGAFEVIECDLIDDEGTLVPDMSEYNLIWSALED